MGTKDEVAKLQQEVHNLLRSVSNSVDEVAELQARYDTNLIGALEEKRELTADVAKLRKQRNRARVGRNDARVLVAELQRQLDDALHHVMLNAEHCGLLVVERDSARKQVRDLMKAAEVAVVYGLGWNDALRATIAVVRAAN